MDNAIPLRAIQNGEFGILKYIKDVCDQNGLKYYLAYGTLIGAVRHHGFIPWDDDVDIHMPRGDYRKFVEIVTNNPHPFYRLIARETSPKFTLALAKVIDNRTNLRQISPWREKVPLGIYVDIFILDGAGDSWEEACQTYETAYSIYSHWRWAVRKVFVPGRSRKKTLRQWIKHIFPEKVRGVRYWINKLDSFSMQKAYNDCRFVAAMAAGTPEASRNVWERAWFGEGTNIFFNGESVRAPDNWDAVLRPEYGDYMEFPPPEKQKPHHNYELDIPDDVLSSYLKSKPT